MKKFTLLLSLLLIASLFQACTDDSLLKENETISKTISKNQIHLNDQISNKIEVYDIITTAIKAEKDWGSKINETYVLESSTVTNLKKFNVSKIEFSLFDKTFVVTDNKGHKYNYVLIATNLKVYEAGLEKNVLKLVPESQNGRFLCRAGCYALFAVMIASDGPSPIVDIIAAATLGECLDFCAKEY